MRKPKLLHVWMILIILFLNLGFTPVAFIAPSAITTGIILYVQPNGLKRGTCSTWGRACNLQYALGIAVSGNEIWVAAGSYYPTTTRNRSATFLLKSGVKVYGGFPNGGGDWGQRDWQVHSSMLSGDIGIIGDVNDNSYHVVTGSGTDGTAILDGFTIESGWMSSHIRSILFH